MKDLKFKNDAADSIYNGIEKLSNAVTETLGPNGKYVMIQKEDKCHITKDGVSVAKEVALKDSFENMGAIAIKEVAQKTNDEAGDGTTTSICLAHEIVSNTRKYIKAGYNVVELCEGLELGKEAVIHHLEKLSKPITSKKEIEYVGAVSANNNKKIGRLIADTMEKIGKDGVITLEASNTSETYSEVVDGLQFKRGFASPHFADDKEKVKSELENPIIFISTEKINSLKEIVKPLEESVSKNRPLLIIAQDYSTEALSSLLVNKARGAVNVYAVKAPHHGNIQIDHCEDIGILVDGDVINKNKNLSIKNYEKFGQAKKVIIEKNKTTIVHGNSNKEILDERISFLKNQIEESDSSFAKEKLRERLANLTGGIAVLYIGASTDSALKEKIDRVEDALNATRAGVESGVVIGGGCALIKCTNTLDKLETPNPIVNMGIQILNESIKKPLKKILSNGEVSSELILNAVKKGDNSFGYNAKTNEFCNMIESGIIDPTKVTKTAIKNSVSIAKLITKSSCVIVNGDSNE